MSNQEHSIEQAVLGSVGSREKELLARHLLANQHLISEYLWNRKWKELLILAEYVDSDAPRSLIGTDPALYRTIRQQITEVRLRWRFNKEKLAVAAQEEIGGK